MNSEKTEEDKLKNVSHRGPTRSYKEKFQALRERYESVTALHAEYERQLEVANARMKKLQAENDLMLDAVSITRPPPAPPAQHSHSDRTQPYSYQQQQARSLEPRGDRPPGSNPNGRSNGVTHSHVHRHAEPSESSLHVYAGHERNGRV